MAPSTAVAILLLGAILSARSRRPCQSAGRVPAAEISALVSAYGLVKFVVLWTEVELPLETILYSGTAFLEKPFTPDALARKVHSVLDAGRS
jgi:hypothetical protein